MQFSLKTKKTSAVYKKGQITHHNESVLSILRKRKLHFINATINILLVNNMLQNVQNSQTILEHHAWTTFNWKTTKNVFTLFLFMKQ